MMDVESYRQYAADCLRLAEGEAVPEEKNILLNVALAWVRLAHQVKEVAQEVAPQEVSAQDVAPQEATLAPPDEAPDAGQRAPQETTLAPPDEPRDAGKPAADRSTPTGPLEEIALEAYKSAAH
jgi:hypothetical protein